MMAPTTMPAISETVTVDTARASFSFAYGPATTAGVELGWETDREIIEDLRPVQDTENVLLYSGRVVLGINGERFAFLTDHRTNLETVRQALELDELLGKRSSVMLGEAVIA